MESLSGISAFVRTAETLSFVAAGRVLGISASAVGKSVAKLEGAMGVRLLQRTTRRVALTEEGALFYDRCRRILDDLREAEAMTARAARAPRGRLRVSLPTVGYHFLAPLLPEFRQRFPEIELDLDFNDRKVDLVEERFDVVIRGGKLPDSSLMSRRLGPVLFVVCASPAYLKRKGTPKSPRDLARHECLRFRFPATGKLQEWLLQGGDSNELRLPSALIFNNMEAVLRAAVEGVGIAYMPHFLARDAIAGGALKRVLPDIRFDGGQFSVLWPSNRQPSPRQKAFVDFLCAHSWMRDLDSPAANRRRSPRA
jgi:DNA-binding transcriptional LysR family regulator